MSEETIYDANDIVLSPCIIQYGDTVLGTTDGAVTIQCQIEYNTSICSKSASAMTTSKRIKNLGYAIEARFVDVAAVRQLILGGNTVTTAEIGKNIYAAPQLLKLTEIGGTVVQTFPAAVLLQSYVENTESTSDATITVAWEAIADDSGVIYQLANTGV